MSVSESAIDIHSVTDPVEVVKQGYDWADVDPSTAIAETLAAVEGCDPAEIGPLYDMLNSDALDTLVQNPQATADCAVVFPYEEYSVTVTGSGEVIIYASAEDVDQ